MADVYHRSGRGGAGNFYSQKDIEEASKRQPEDLEAQKQFPDDEPPTDPADVPEQSAPVVTSAPSNGNSGSVKAYARAGRGGAGNFVENPTSATTTTSPTTDISSTTHQPASSAPRAGLSGRGGAGNWTTGEDGEEVYDPEQERKRREALDAHILQDIRESLPQPSKIYYMHGPGRGRKPETLPT